MSLTSATPMETSKLPPAFPASITGEFITDKFALYDYALKANTLHLSI